MTRRDVTIAVISCAVGIVAVAGFAVGRSAPPRNPVADRGPVAEPGSIDSAEFGPLSSQEYADALRSRWRGTNYELIDCQIVSAPRGQRRTLDVLVTGNHDRASMEAAARDIYGQLRSELRVFDCPYKRINLRLYHDRAHFEEPRNVDLHVVSGDAQQELPEWPPQSEIHWSTASF